LLLIFELHINKKIRKKGKIQNTKKYILKENQRKILVRKIYQNTQKIIEDGLEKTKHTRLKNLIVYFRLIKALLAKKI
jgi:hypothetical protein